ncbi:hypothetical protein; putative signal peptide [Bradyrhizobium sp. ORS 278]|uniref:hypothetical protein n=1 Tax=Bradyrhizobium sp. (strain ORS 278) TaxID=114615 RepID=UPI0001508029|nr:hypothetical protein [Bradyrhizobium sp. ORS 278]CAL77462.1 hypothetical protein; putative signal peptide [Bradyrhizobium sp. ORS 278]
MSAQDSGGGRGGAIAALVFAAVMVGFGLWLAHSLTAASKMQDCLMSGRSNCNVIAPER